jgi:methionyl aminopeptidase
MDTKTLVKTDKEIAIMRRGCQILASVFDLIAPRIVVGASAADLDVYAEKLIRDADCVPAFKGYDSGGPTPFPGTMCFSRNHEIVHGIPGAEDIIEDADLVKIDIGLVCDGYYADMARTFVMPQASQEARDLAKHTQRAFEKGIARIHDGARLNDFSEVVETYARSLGYGIVRGLVGHGVGTDLHIPPQIPNYVAKEFDNFTFRAGMTVAIEPMINIGTDDIDTGPDGWTIVTADGSLSAHHENTILVTERGYEILTQKN